MSNNDNSDYESETEYSVTDTENLDNSIIDNNIDSVEELYHNNCIATYCYHTSRLRVVHFTK